MDFVLVNGCYPGDTQSSIDNMYNSGHHRVWGSNDLKTILLIYGNLRETGMDWIILDPAVVNFVKLLITLGEIYVLRTFKWEMLD